MEKIIEFETGVYLFKFGIRSLIALDTFLNKNEQEKRNDKDSLAIVFCLSLKDNVKSTQEDIYKLYYKLKKQYGKEYIRSLLEEVWAISVGTDFNDKSVSLSTQVEELYVKAVGEIGIAPDLFYKMSPREIEAAYKGYLRKKELEGNCMLIALRKARDSKAELISLLPKDFRTVTTEYREQALEALDIK